MPLAKRIAQNQTAAAPCLQHGAAVVWPLRFRWTNSFTSTEKINHFQGFPKIIFRVLSMNFRVLRMLAL